MTLEAGRPSYDYRNCSSLFGYAAAAHIRSGAVCQLCGCGAGAIDFDLWRQMTVEHLIGESQGGYQSAIAASVVNRFPDLSPAEHDDLTRLIDEANTVTACGFCNSTTSRNRAPRGMAEVIEGTPGSSEEVLGAVEAETAAILQQKRADVEWKLSAVRRAFNELLVPQFPHERRDSAQPRLDTDTAITESLQSVEAFAGPRGLTDRIGALELQFVGATRDSALERLAGDGLSGDNLTAALAVKRAAGQINVTIHAMGILLALPHILGEGEVVEQLSLGAGNTGREFDLVTNRQVAEFKFIAWQGGPESIRQNTVFIDLFRLAETDTEKRRVLYLTELDRPLRFLGGGRALKSVLSKNAGAAEQFFARHGDSFRVVRDYWTTIRGRVELVDLSLHLPMLKAMPTDSIDEAASGLGPSS